MSRRAQRPLYDEIQELRALYPVSRSATLPALRLAQERYGWLSPEAFREVAEALEETPAYCMAVASFYDMFHLEPVGRHLVEVCTNISCALVGAQQVLEAFERELGVHAGETTEDGCAMPVSRVLLEGADERDLTKLSEYRAIGGYAALQKARGMEAAAVVEELLTPKLRGGGGAVFPMG